jgi:mannose-6-phosphate isomerase
MNEHTASQQSMRQRPLPQQTEAPQSEERPWGRWTILYEAPGVKVKLIEVLPGHRLSLQYHRHRSEHWVCVAGTADAVIGDVSLTLRPMRSAVIGIGTIHRLGNSGPEPVAIIEVQKGDDLREEDIVRLEDDYHRAAKTSER